MMGGEYIPEYIKIEQYNDYNKNKNYYVAYIDSYGKLNTTEVMINDMYSEQIPFRRSNKYDVLVKLKIAEYKYLTILHKWLNFKNITYNFCDSMIRIEFLETTELGAKIAFLNRIRNYNGKYKNALSMAHDNFADEYPQEYFERLLTYRGFSMNQLPKYNHFINKETEQNCVTMEYHYA